MEEKSIYYNNAPIILSLLQIRFNKIEEFNIPLIESLAKEVKSDFPILKKAITHNISINENDDKTKISLGDRTIDQVHIISEDKKSAFIIEKDKFTYQSQKKYENLDELIEIFLSFWKKFSSGFNLNELTRVSLRHVNKFKLPTDLKSLNQYFTTYLHDDKNTHSISNLQFRFTERDKENDLLLHIGHSLENAIANHVPYIFDIDTICMGNIKNNEKEILKIFKKIRIKKNEVFNSGITDKAKRLIE